MAKDLKAKGVPHFIPVISKKTVRRNLLRPLFPGYIFFIWSTVNRRSVLETGRTVQIINILNQDQFKDELSQILLALESGLKIDPYYDIIIGMPCRIIAGPGTGIVGKVIKKTDRQSVQKVILEISSINKSILLEVEAGCVEAIV